MSNCFNYHIKTAHTFESVRKPYFLDWNNYPNPFKIYKGVKTFQLPEPSGETKETLDTLFQLCSGWGEDNLSLQELSNLCFALNGVSAVEVFHGEEFYFRTSPSAGALYPFEVYLAVKEIPQIPDGLYHYQPTSHSLELLLKKNVFPQLQSALCAEIPGNVVAFVSTIYARSAWKYRTRAYRYCLLDAGHSIANGVTYLRSIGVGGNAVALFKDNALNSLLGLDGENEFTVAAVLIDKPALFWGDEFLVSVQFPSALPIVKYPIENSEIVNTHLSGNLEDCEFYRDYPEEALPIPGTTSPPLMDVLKRRRSRREFTGELLPFEKAKFLLESSLNCFPCDWGFPKTNIYVQINNVEGVKDGVYAVGNDKLYPIMEGNFSKEIAYLSLGQSFLSKANINVIFTFDFESTTCRDYRAAMLESGSLGELLYLAAEALGLGACGIGAFYDYDLKVFLGLPEFEVPLYIVAIGVPKVKT